nr:hypothetical protein [Nodosilinea sp. TSF1-S3]MDF0369703.1 hypothetical protein [Nodosilinea sp. TSF1-S3]
MALAAFISHPFSPFENKLSSTQASETPLVSLDRNSQIGAEFTPDLSDSPAFTHVSDVLLPGEFLLLSTPPEDLVVSNLRYPLPSSDYHSVSIEEPELAHGVRGGDKEFAVQRLEFTARLPEWGVSET